MKFKEPINVELASKIIGCNRVWTRRLARAGKIIGQKLTEREWLFERESVEEWAKNGPQPGRPRGQKPRPGAKARKADKLPPLRDPIGTPEAAAILGCGVSRVCQKLRAGEIVGWKTNERGWVLERAEAEKHVQPESTGRPRGGRG